MVEKWPKGARSVECCFPSGVIALAALKDYWMRKLAATKISAPSFASFEEQIRLARAAEIEARRIYFDHVNTHGCP